MSPVSLEEVCPGRHAFVISELGLDIAGIYPAPLGKYRGRTKDARHDGIRGDLLSVYLRILEVLSHHNCIRPDDLQLWGHYGTSW